MRACVVISLPLRHSVQRPPPLCSLLQARATPWLPRTPLLAHHRRIRWAIPHASLRRGLGDCAGGWEWVLCAGVVRGGPIPVTEERVAHTHTLSSSILGRCGFDGYVFPRAPTPPPAVLATSPCVLLVCMRAPRSRPRARGAQVSRVHFGVALMTHTHRRAVLAWGVYSDDPQPLLPPLAPARSVCACVCACAVP